MMQTTFSFFKAEKLYFFGKIFFSDEHKIPWLHLIYLLGEDALEWRFLVVLTHGFHAAWKPGFCLQRSQSVGDGRGMTYALVSL